MPADSYFATAPKGVEPLLAAELRALGAADVREARGGVSFAGELAVAYRACLWSRTANRILLPLAHIAAGDADALYAGIAALPWEQHLDPQGTLAVDFVSSGTSGIRHTQYGAQRSKDAICDRLRERFGVRPSVDREAPDLRINVHAVGEHADVAIDLSGDSLHRRGYRSDGALAPLKENLAAALLLKAGWADIAAAGGGLLDPMCGSGTFVIEAALIAADIAPGLGRSDWGFYGWQQHQPQLWRALVEEARARRAAGLARPLPALVGSDHESRAIRAALANAENAGLHGRVHFETRELAAAVAPKGAPGLLIVNPPYGERLGEVEALAATYALLGDRLKTVFKGWQAAVFTGNPELGKRMGLRAHKTHSFYNGPIACKLLRFTVDDAAFVDRDAADRRQREHTLQQALAGGGEALLNRLQKNLRTLGRWANREGIECYRLYDADIPEYAIAVDLYGEWVHVQEYEAPRSIDADKAQQRLQQAMTILPHALGIPAERIALKVRRRQKGSAQYERQASRGDYLEVHEGPARLWVNLFDYLDTGLFLDHRITRARVGELARGQDFLNLFAYTGAATVHAALAGARSTTTVDMSATYLDWAQANMELNGLTGPEHRYERADCLAWLERARGRFGTIFLDPPTFSNSKRMEDTFDVQRDHVRLIRAALRLLTPDGVLVFSNNHRRFRLDTEALADLQIEDISARTIPKDFERNPRIHRCWTIRHG
ncbi:bifunctional 23S rRNA (guanine(2069)-N(7))-methyltransferase RlmK/23S rRNA (guanine(2445)-N(2))-methyltransferase RlmL [Plasticicumulans acidivorans]|uniref:Ribosomal RNA large subunit methyltransferase K/L n=1 Tax=Plasticicumulans acidivorans TaxID=886464 RepID=A0A317MUR1_9GAMM|nr:bifunctional 23S rRNA (guanine(2069)-N(7))-methyltransferase RlmK/23S rRNA (guanine(2445)-N(2))-methyltransferase RlmL [Plasticicumulans acidivorans]PWV61657.1 23S rRNA m(2)G-2445 methyltransferase [Plasticicumulans acidivorans]